MISSVIYDLNFQGFVLGRIEANFRNQIFVGKLLTRSIRLIFLCTAPLAKFQQIFIKLFANFASISKEIRKILHFKMRFHRDFRRFSRKFIGFSQIFQKMPNYITIPRSFADFSEKTFKKAEFSGHGYAKKSDSVNHIPSVLQSSQLRQNWLLTAAAAGSGRRGSERSAPGIGDEKQNWNEIAEQS